MQVLRRTLPPPFAWLAIQKNFSALCGPRLSTGNVQDSADQSIAAGATQVVIWDTMITGTQSTGGALPGAVDIPLQANQAAIFEDGGAVITARDASNKIQIQSVVLSTQTAVTTAVQPIGLSGALPYTLPALIGAQLSAALEPGLYPAYALGSEGAALFLRATMTLVNLDGAAAHLYRRVIRFSFRLVTGLDPSIGTSWGDYQGR